MAGTIIANDRQARDAEAQIAELDAALSTERIFHAMAEGVPQEVMPAYRRSLTADRTELTRKLFAYQKAREGDVAPLRQQAGRDLGAHLIVARIAKRLTHKQLARKLGLKEQAVQRYEAEQYRSITLSSFQRIAEVLDLRLVAEQRETLRDEWGLPLNVDHSIALRVLKHARERGWLGEVGYTNEEGVDALKREIGEHVLRHGKPSLLRTGLGVEDHSQDLSLLAWRTAVARQAEQKRKSLRGRFRLSELGWIRGLVKQSADEARLASIPDILSEHGIVLVVEPTVPGMKVDGAAFILDETPVIGMTLLRDTIDNFWFTLIHELGHIVLHFWTGLQSGFFDDVDASEPDDIESEANEFASNCLIPNEIWARSPARIAKAVEPVHGLCSQLGIHPAIAFGRIRKERNNYKIFADRIGQGKVRRALLAS